MNAQQQVSFTFDIGINTHDSDVRRGVKFDRALEKIGVKPTDEIRFAYDIDWDGYLTVEDASIAAQLSAHFRQH